MRRIATLALAAFVLSIAAPAGFAGPFSDVKQGHWAYGAIQKAVDSGILQGYDGKFHGTKRLNRYQMAVIVARMLDRVSTMPKGKVSGKDIRNLEALTIEFADELALINVKVSTLEDGFAKLKRDVDHLKADFAMTGPRAGISGLVQARLVLTDTDPNKALGRGTGATFAPAATSPIARYVAGIPSGAPNAANTASGTERTFFNMAQTSIGFDRHFDKDYYLHLQLDIDADQESVFISGNQIQVNEAYIDAEDLLLDGDVRVRAGVWALPFSRERNPEMAEYAYQLRYGFRTLDLTVTPSLMDSTWEQVRAEGVGLWNGKDAGFQWQVGVANSTAPAGTRDGSVLAWRQSLQGGTTVATAGARAQINQYGDSVQGVDNNPTGAAGQDNLGYYAWAGDKYDSGLRWDLGYFDNGGDIAPGAGNTATANAWRGFQFNAGYWGWEDFGFMASYFAATSDSNNAAGVAGGAAAYMTAAGGLAAALPAGSAYPDLDSTSWSVMANYKFNDDNNVSVRYEDVADEFGPAQINATVLTFGWNHRMSANSLLQLEYSTPESDTRAAGLNAAGTGYVAGATNTVDVADDLLQINYKVRF